MIAFSSAIIGRRVRVVLGLSALAMYAATAAARAAEPAPFDTHSMQALRCEFSGRPFVLAFWSVSCEPCREELAHWGILQRMHPELPVVLVATDPPQDRAVVNALLDRHDLGRVRVMMFADEFAERLRYSIDRSWRGEVPRSYFFDARHRAEARTGPVDPRWAESWLARPTAGR